MTDIIKQVVLVRGTSIPDNAKLLNTYRVNANMDNKLYGLDAKDDTQQMYMALVIKGVTMKVYQFAEAQHVHGALAYHYVKGNDSMVTLHKKICEGQYRNASPLITLWSMLGDYYGDGYGVFSTDLWENDILRELEGDDDAVGTISFGKTDFTATLADDAPLDGIWGDYINEINEENDHDDPTEHTDGSSEDN